MTPSQRDAGGLLGAVLSAAVAARDLIRWFEGGPPPRALRPNPVDKIRRALASGLPPAYKGRGRQP